MAATELTVLPVSPVEWVRLDYPVSLVLLVARVTLVNLLGDHQDFPVRKETAAFLVCPACQDPLAEMVILAQKEKEETPDSLAREVLQEILEWLEILESEALVPKENPANQGPWALPVAPAPCRSKDRRFPWSDPEETRARKERRESPEIWVLEVIQEEQVFQDSPVCPE